jgi:hypothetical protein
MHHALQQGALRQQRLAPCAAQRIGPAGDMEAITLRNSSRRDGLQPAEAWGVEGGDSSPSVAKPSTSSPESTAASCTTAACWPLAPATMISAIGGSALSAHHHLAELHHRRDAGVISHIADDLLGVRGESGLKTLQRVAEDMAQRDKGRGVPEASPAIPSSIS